MADQLTATFKRPVQSGQCGLCDKDKTSLVSVTFEASTIAGSYCKACFFKLLHMTTARLTGPAQAPASNGAPAKV
jgi:hypothetical protein